MNVRFDEDVLLAKATTVRRCLGIIRRLWFENDPPVPEWIRLDVTVLNLQRAVEACLDIANHLIAVNAWRLPGSAVEAMQSLADAGLLPPTEMPLFRGMVGFRNVAVHNYTEIDQAIVATIVNEHLDDLERFTAQILEATIGRS